MRYASVIDALTSIQGVTFWSEYPAIMAKHEPPVSPLFFPFLFKKIESWRALTSLHRQIIPEMPGGSSSHSLR